MTYPYWHILSARDWQPMNDCQKLLVHVHKPEEQQTTLGQHSFLIQKDEICIRCKQSVPTMWKEAATLVGIPVWSKGYEAANATEDED